MEIKGIISNMKNRKIFKVFRWGYIFLIFVWLCSFLLAFVSANEYIYKFLMFIGLVVVFPILLVTFGLPLYLLYVLFIALIRNIKWYFKIMGITLAISIITIVIGFGIFLFGSNVTGTFEIDEVSVIDVRNNKMLVDCSKKYLGDTKTVEIHKPFFIKVRPGDVVDVKYSVGNIEKMHYIINYKVGEAMLLKGFVALFTILFIIILMDFFITGRGSHSSLKK